jgi:pilus assembly protein CpaC
MITRNLTNRAMITFLAVTIAFSLSVSASCFAAGPDRVQVSVARTEKTTVTVGKSIIIESPAPIKRVSIADPNIADALVLTPWQVYVTAKRPGLTNLTLWGNNDQVSTIFDLEVQPDITLLKAKLHEMYPQEKNIQVTGTNDSITLAGTVSSAATLAQVLAIAQSYAPLDKDGKAKLINVLEVGGVHQVMLEVRVSEMSRNLGRRLGVNFGFVSASGNQFGLTLLNNLTRLPQQGFPANPLNVSDNVSAITRFLGDGASWTVFIDALKEQGLIKVLAEPTLISLSGKPANFLAGGEFPIPITQPSAAGSIITVQYKPFGVGLNFTPTVLSNGKINMQVAPEVSELDFSQAIALQGFVIPSITTRRVSTNVELADGQSFAVAGLLRDEVRENIRKFPLLGDIPILGALFRSTSYQKNETELVIIVTPHLVKPVDMAKQTLPTDQFIDPDDFDFYLLGRIEGTADKSEAPTPAVPPLAKKGGLEGTFGHIMP